MKQPAARPPFDVPLFALAVFALLGVLAGCGGEEEIERYYVDKPPAATKQRLLGAIVPRGPQCWFFKMIGPADSVAPHAEGFTALVESIRFGEGEGTTPTWDLPEGWRQDPGRGMRLATIRPDPDDSALEMSVIPLPVRGPDIDGYVLSNVNRWRGQVGLDGIEAGRLAEQTTAVALGDATATIVDVTGKRASDGAHPMSSGSTGMGRN